MLINLEVVANDLFRAEDIQRVLSATPLHPVEHFDAQAAAAQANRMLMMASLKAANVPEHLAPAALKRRLASISSATGSLLVALGFDRNHIASSLGADIGAHPGLTAIKNILCHQLLTLPNRQKTKNDKLIYDIIHLYENNRNSDAPNTTNNNMKDLRIKSITSCYSYLDELPYILSLIIIAINSQFSPIYNKNKPTHSRVFIDSVFDGLALIHDTTFSVPLKTADAQRGPRGPSTLWAAAFLTCAWERLKERESGFRQLIGAPTASDFTENFRTPSADALFEAHCLPWAVKARRLREGKKRLPESSMRFIQLMHD